MGGHNEQLQIEMKIERTIKDAKNGVRLKPYDFKTVDKTNKLKYFNRGRAIAILLVYLLDKKLIGTEDLLIIGLKYDWNKGDKEIMRKVVDDWRD